MSWGESTKQDQQFHVGRVLTQTPSVHERHPGVELLVALVDSWIPPSEQRGQVCGWKNPSTPLFSPQKGLYTKEAECFERTERRGEKSSEKHGV